MAAYRGTGSAIAAFIDLAEAAGADCVVPIAAAASPSGPVHNAAFETMAGRTCDAVAQGCDAVLLDHSDNCASGGTKDTMTVLGAMLDAGLDDAAAFAIFDPAAVQQMIAAGVGREITLQLGGKLDMPSIGLKGQPRSVTGRIKLVCDGRCRDRGPMFAGGLNDMGPTAVLDTGKIQIVVISNHVEPHDLAAFTAVGIAPERCRYLMLKSRVHWRAGLRSLAHAVVECAGTGVCSSDYALLGLHKVRRPIYPIDPM